MRRQALGAGGHGHGERPAADRQPARRRCRCSGRWGSFTPSGDLVLETRAWRERMFAARAPAAGADLPGPWSADPRPHQQRDPRRHDGRHGRRRWRSTSCSCRWTASTSPPFLRKWSRKKLNTILDARYIVPQRIGEGPPAAQARQAAPGGDLLHRRDERADRRARPGARPPRPHGPPHLVPHADEGRPRGHLRPVPREGRPRSRPRHAASAATSSRG